VTLSSHVGEMFTVRTASAKITYLLKKEQGRWGESYPHHRYHFAEISREAAGEESYGLVLEERKVTADLE